MIDTGSYTSETSTDEGTETGMLSESTDEIPVQTNEVPVQTEEILHALTEYLKRSYPMQERS